MKYYNFTSTQASLTKRDPKKGNNCQVKEIINYNYRHKNKSLNLMSYSKRTSLVLAILLFFTFIAYGQTKPNIVLILADDLGYGCIGAYGAPTNVLRTPSIDNLAAQGRKFTHAYTPSSLCSPTRYGLLTGLYEWRERNPYGVNGVYTELTIPLDKPTIASRLREAGYSTAAIGKWHLGYQNQSPVNYRIALRPGPFDIGFDYHWGIPNNNGDQSGIWVDNDYVWGLDLSKTPEYFNQPSSKIGIPAPYREDEFTMGTLDIRVNEWIDAQSNDTPFFLYFASPAIHTPLTPGPDYQGASNGGKYTDYIMELDGSVKNIIDALDRNGFTENTIVIFTSDNGAAPGGAREATAIGLKVNGDFRGTKLSIFEAGFRVPLIIKWPNKIAPGSSSSEIVNLVDIYASIMEMLDLKMQPPDVEAGDSYSFYPAWFEDLSEPVRDNMILTSIEGIVALQSDGWKYIDGEVKDPGNLRFFHDDRKAAEAHEQLYKVNDDPNETNDVFYESAEKVLEMKALLKQLWDQGYSRVAFPAIKIVKD